MDAENGPDAMDVGALDDDAERGEELETVPEGHEDLRHDPRLKQLRERGRFEHGCQHYKRRCRMVAPCCGEVFWCRHCHNKAKNEEEEKPESRHELDRKQVRELVCALCADRQPLARHCRSCQVSFGAYGCLRCAFFEDETASRKQFHCEQCGLCRIGGRASFFHCDTCGCCYTVSLKDNHRCVENSMRGNCPICFEFLFDSIQPTSVLRCGHTLHEHCFQEMQQNNQTSCPVCMKSFANMQPVWQAIEAERRETAMPLDYINWSAKVHCNDCGADSEEAFHVMGQRCGGPEGCGSFNTRRVGIQKRPPTAEQRQQVAARLAAMRDAAQSDGRVPAALAELHAAQAAAAQAIAQQVANAEARGEEVDEQVEEVQAARAAEREAAAQLVAHQEQVVLHQQVAQGNNDVADAAHMPDDLDFADEQ